MSNSNVMAWIDLLPNVGLLQKTDIKVRLASTANLVPPVQLNAMRFKPACPKNRNMSLFGRRFGQRLDAYLGHALN